METNPESVNLRNRSVLAKVLTSVKRQIFHYETHETCLLHSGYSLLPLPCPPDGQSYNFVTVIGDASFSCAQKVLLRLQPQPESVAGILVLVPARDLAIATECYQIIEYNIM